MRERLTWGFAIAIVVVALSAGTALGETRRTELVSTGAGGSGPPAPYFAAVSKDGTKAFFVTADSLVPEDNDLCDRSFDGYFEPPSPCYDLYVRDLKSATTALVSTGPTGGSGPYDANFPRYSRSAVSADGNRIFFETAEPFVGTDTDDKVDVYERDLVTGTTKLISTGPTDQGISDATFAGASADGSKAFFLTNDRLVAADTDSYQDGYMREGDTTTLLSIGPNGGNGPWDAGAGPASLDGSRVFVGTREALLAEDTDYCPSANPGGCADVYERDLTTGSLELVTTGPHGNQTGYGVGLWGQSDDGKRVVFSTAEPLVDKDVESGCPTNHDGNGEVGCVDLYLRDLTTHTTTLVSTGPKKTGSNGTGTTDDPEFRYVTPDGERVFFATREQLVDADTDASIDAYQRVGDVTTLLSASANGGNSENPSSFMTSSTDGRIVYVGTYDPLLPEDTDGRHDIYELSGGTFKLATTGPVGGNGAYDARGFTASADGRRYFFYTAEQLVPEDTNGKMDVYERFNGTTTLISKGPTGSGSDEVPNVRAGQDGRTVFFTTPYRLVAGDTDNSNDIYASVANGPPRCGPKPGRGRGRGDGRAGPKLRGHCRGPRAAH